MGVARLRAADARWRHPGRAVSSAFMYHVMIYISRKGHTCHAGSKDDEGRFRGTGAISLPAPAVHALQRRGDASARRHAVAVPADAADPGLPRSLVGDRG